jgi:serine/threonine protein phosphatase 1
MTASVVRRFDANGDGRDFVVGDIHGEYAQLNARLSAVGFDPARDRLFSVGDLCDRGPDSARALDWLAQPWFHPVLGNHEDMLLRAETDEDARHWWVTANGGGWWLDCDASTQDRFVEAFSALPLAIDIHTPRGRVGIVHADVPGDMTWGEFLQALASGDGRLRQHALWARGRVMSTNAQHRRSIEGAYRIYCGHTPLQRPAAIGNVYLLDTGACYEGGSLTVVPMLD